MYPRAALQAIQVKKTALVLPEPKGNRVGQTGNGQGISLLVLGDSSAAGVGVADQQDALTGQLVNLLAQTHRVNWQLLAASGATSGWAEKQLASHDTPCPDLVVVALGVNDVKNGVSLNVWRARVQRILDLLNRHPQSTKVYWSALPPMGRFPLLPEPLRGMLGRRSIRFDEALQSVLTDHPIGRYLPLEFDLDEADMAEDGFHPGPAIYAEWARHAARMIYADLDKTQPHLATDKTKTPELPPGFRTRKTKNN